MAEQTPADQPTVLVVEDNRELADLMADWLADTATVEVAYDGETALERLDETVDVVLLDRRMPGLSGDEVLGIIREREMACHVVIVSAVSPDFDVIGMGFDGYLTKPVSAEDVREAVERVRARDAYDETVQELYRLVETKSALEAEKSESALQASAAYRELEARIADVQAQADLALDEFDDDDFTAALSDL